tara:strand:+ start:89 stop:955 length:867 start_codon:yes stop_codon:yes gene_type:complete
MRKYIVESSSSVLHRKASINDISIVLTSPHSGSFYPEFFKKELNLSISKVRTIEDVKVDKILNGLNENNFDILTTDCPRSLIDLNRSKLDIDPSMFYNLPKNIEFVNIKSKHGIGLFLKNIDESNIMYNKKIDWLTRDELIKKIYEPWHNKLSEILKSKYNAHKNYLLIDVHSFGSHRENENYDFIISDNFSKSAQNKFVYFLKDLMEKNGFKVSLNYPYSGGYIVKNYSNKELDKNVIQIEINKKLYLNNDLEINDKFFDLRDFFHNAMKSLDLYLKNYYSFNRAAE